MDRSRFGACLATLTLILLATPAQAGCWWSNFCAELEVGRQRNNCWPIPFTNPDRQHVLDTMEAQTANGWRRYNLLGDHHFSEDGSQLTEAAKLKIRWILTQEPEHRRTLFVHRGLTPQITQARIDAVQNSAVGAVPEGHLPSVVDTHLMVEGRPAADIDATNTRFRDTKPEPQLPASDPGEAQ